MTPPTHDDTHNKGQGCQCAHRRRCRRRVGGGLCQHSEYDGHDGDGDQHDDGAADDGRDNPAQPGETPGEQELEQRGNDDKGGEQGGAALDQGGDAHRDEGAGGTHQQDITGTDVAEPASLDNRRYAADKECRERRPCQQRITQSGGANHNGRREHNAGNGQHGVLQAEAKSQGFRWIFVCLIADLR